MTDKVEIKINVPDLEESNYEVWKGKMMWQLQLYKLSNMVEKKHDDTIKAVADYAENNMKACIVMKDKMCHQFVQKVDHFATAFEIWNFLDVYFIWGEKTRMAKFFEDLINTRDNFSDCGGLVSTLTRLREGINKTTLDLDEVVRYFLIRALPDAFDSVKVVIENSNANLEENFQSVIKAERRMKQEMSKSILAAQTVRNNANLKKEYPLCLHCGQFGHPPWRCRDRPRKNNDQNQQNSNPSSKNENIHRNENPVKFGDNRQESDQKSVLGCFGMSSLESSGSETSDSDSCRFGCMISGVSQKSFTVELPKPNKVVSLEKEWTEDQWFLDSGAEEHVANSSEKFQSIRPVGKSMYCANGSDLDIRGVGRCALDFDGITLTLNKCYFAPGLFGNFLSVSKLCDAGYEVCFTSTSCLILKNNETIAERIRKKNMYAIKTKSSFFLSPLTTDLTAKKNKDKLNCWHRALGHVNFKYILRMKDQLGLQIPAEELQCEICEIAKCHRLPFKRKKIRTTKPLQLIHTDVCGPIKPSSIEGFRYFLTFTDDYTRFSQVYVLSSRTQVYEKFLEYKAYVENHHNDKIKTLRSDNGTEYTSNQFKDFLYKCGIRHELTNPHTPQQNGVAERFNRTINEGVRAVLLESRLPASLWPYAVNYMTMVKNCVPHSATNFQVPYKLWNNLDPPYELFHPFGCPVVAWNPVSEGKFAPTGIRGRLVGYPRDRRGFLVRDEETRRIFPSRDIKLLRNSDSTAECTSQEVLDLFEEYESQFDLPADVEKVALTSETVPTASSTDSPATNQIQAPKVSVSNSQSALSHDETEDDRYVYMTDFQLQQFRDEYPDVIVAPLPGRPKLIPNARGRPSKAYHYRIGCLMSIREVNEALSKREKETWNLINRPPKTKVVKNRWVLTRKEDGRFKARLVAKGFTQKFGIDYQETFSPVIRSTSVRLLLTHAHAMKMHVHHVDVKNAYLNSPIQETVYMEQPYLFEVGGDKVCLLKKSIYGLKQAAKCWHDKLVEILASLGLKRLDIEPCIATNTDQSLIVGFYVDDLIILSNDINAIITFKLAFGKIVKITDKGEIQTFVELEIKRNSQTLCISQTRYIESLLERHQMQNCNSVPTPFPVGTVTAPEEHDPVIPNIHRYQSIVGELMYLANMTKPDISYTVGQLARYMNGVQGGDAYGDLPRHCYSLHASYKFIPNSPDVWIGDSGAGKHMTPRREWFSTYTPLPPGRVMVEMGDKTMKSSVSVGTVPIVTNKGMELELAQVLHVPELGHNLFSLREVTKRKFIIQMIDDDIFVFNNFETILTGRDSGESCYIMDFSVKSTSSALVAKPIAPSIEVWHQRFGHTNYATVKRMIREGHVDGLICGSCNPPEFCEACILGKMTRKSFETSFKRAEEPGELFHFDIAGPFEVKSISGASFLSVFVDDLSGMTFAFAIKAKSDIVYSIMKVISIAKSSNLQKKRVRSDNALEFRSQATENLLLQHGIVHEYSSPYNPEQNGRAEQQNRTIVEIINTLKADAQLPNFFWAELANTAAYLRNFIPLDRLHGKTPFEIWFGHKPDVSHLRVIGSRAFAHVPNGRKLDNRAEELILVGYEPKSHSYRLWKRSTNGIKISPSVKIIEPHIDTQVQPVIATINEGQQLAEQTAIESIASRTRSKAAVDSVDVLSHKIPLCFALSNEAFNTPQTFEEAVGSPQAHFWIEAMQEEMDSLYKNNTYFLVDQSECSKKSLKSKWVYKTKMDQNGNIIRLKARLCVKGCSQKPGVDFSETFSPVSRFETIRILLAVAAQRNFQLCQFDIGTAFLNGELQ